MTAAAARIQTDVDGRILRPAWDLRWWQLWSRAWSQYEIHLGLYRIMRNNQATCHASLHWRCDR